MLLEMNHPLLWLLSAGMRGECTVHNQSVGFHPIELLTLKIGFSFDNLTLSICITLCCYVTQDVSST